MVNSIPGCASYRVVHLTDPPLHVQYRKEKSPASQHNVLFDDVVYDAEAQDGSLVFFISVLNRDEVGPVTKSPSTSKVLRSYIKRKKFIDRVFEVQFFPFQR